MKRSSENNSDYLKCVSFINSKEKESLKKTQVNLIELICLI